MKFSALLPADLDAAGSDIGEVDLRHEPPEIVLSTEPAMRVTIDGDPVFEDIEGSAYERVVNTPFLIVRDGRTHYIYVASNAW